MVVVHPWLNADGDVGPLTSGGCAERRGRDVEIGICQCGGRGSYRAVCTSRLGNRRGIVHTGAVLQRSRTLRAAGGARNTASG